MTLAALRSRRAALLGVAALLAYTPGFWWGAPHATAADRTNAWGVDDEPPLGPLAQAHDIIAPKKEMNPNLGYPMLHPFMVLGAFAPYVAYLKVSGGQQGTNTTALRGASTPDFPLRVSLVTSGVSLPIFRSFGAIHLTSYDGIHRIRPTSRFPR